MARHVITQAAEDALRAQSLADGRIPAWESEPHVVPGFVWIMLNRDVEAGLRAVKQPNETFSDVILRLVHGGAKP